MGILAAIPASVLPDHVDHSWDELIARVNRLTSMDEALALLQGAPSAATDRRLAAPRFRGTGGAAVTRQRRAA